MRLDRRFLLPVALACSAAGCVDATVDVPQMCSESPLQFEAAAPPPDVPAGAASADVTVSASTSFDFTRLGGIEGDVRLLEVSLLLAPDELDKITQIVAIVQHAGDQAGLEVLRIDAPMSAQATGDTLSVASQMDRPKFVDFVRRGPTTLTYAISGQLSAAGMTARSRICVATSIRQEHSVL